jgi:hypothetical protein
LDKNFFSEEFKNKAVFTINLISKKIFEWVATLHYFKS